MKAAAALLLLISFYLFGGHALRAVLPQQGGVHVSQFNRAVKGAASTATASVQKQGDASSLVSLSDLDDEDDILRKFVPLVKWLTALSIVFVLHVLCQLYKPRLPSLFHSSLSGTNRLSRLSIFRI